MEKPGLSYKLQKFKTFFTKDIWQTDLNPLSKQKKAGFISLRVVFIILRGFKKDKCNIYAAALTNITIMSMVPTLAFMFAIAHGFGFYKKLKIKIESDLEAMGPRIKEFLLKLINNLENMDMSALGIVGLAIIFWTVLSLLSKIEGTFNVIWGIKRSRDFITKCKEYFFVLMIVPTCLLLTTTVTAVLRSHKVEDFLSGKFGDLFYFYEMLIFLISPLSVALAFTYLYKFLPNTKVKFSAAFIAGLVTMVLWQLLQWAYVKFQLGVSNFNAVYGTFASIPLFMAWLYMSWLLILFGAELSFAIQNHNTYEDEVKSEDYSFKTQLSLALYLTRDLSFSFMKGEKWTAPDVLHRLRIPTRFGNTVLNVLCQGGIMKRVEGKDGEYLPARDLHTLKLRDVLKSVFGEEDKLVDQIQRKEFQELIGMNNRRLDEYIKDIGETNLYDLINESETDQQKPEKSNEVSNKKV